MKSFALFLITVYQKVFSPLMGSCCRFYPCCSEYAREAIKKHGIPAGLWMSFRRVCRCHPLNSGGFDPVT